eukprot:TRINITY_DN1067_c0_g3_i1.p1 TRINITY_DN1067_c0_g3~~TRINITY_DN1067_c0_g3_i1.p1  ORF type:complete len:497 (-),score=92.51 TRINITY_DN1067_c0_g3_i1:26-1516(-)
MRSFVSLFLVSLACALHLAHAQTFGDFKFVVTNVTLPAAMKTSSAYFRPNSGSTSQPAPIYLQAMGDNTLRVGWSGSGQVYVMRFDSNGNRVAADDMSTTATELRGMYVHNDGVAAMLTWDQASTSIYLRKFGSNGVQVWSTQLENDRAVDFSLGGSDLTYARDPYSTTPRYQAYYKVHGTAASCWSGSDGHEGDTLKMVNDSGIATMGYCWGLSHSMNSFLAYNPALNRSLLAGVTDCFPGSASTSAALGSLRLVQYPASAGGLGSGNLATTNIKDVYANCGGQYGGDIGRPIAVNGGFLVPFYAPNVAVSAGAAFSGTYDIGIVRVTPGATPNAAWVASPITWLTSTSENELYPHIAPWKNGNYLIAFARNVAGTYKTFMGVIDPNFAYVSPPVDVSSAVAIGERHGFVVYPNGDVGWAYPWGNTPSVSYPAAINTLKVVRLSSLGIAPTPFIPLGGAPKAGTAGSPGASTASQNAPFAVVIFALSALVAMLLA